MAENDPQTNHLAVLIDADNTSAEHIKPLLKEIAQYGVANVKRIYGDWTSPHLTKWKDKLLEHSINPVQQFAYVAGKDATDMALIIDAMDLLYTNRFDGFCIVSSDSDFTPLAIRLREQAIKVYGFGERKTKNAFVEACDKFIYLDILGPPKNTTEKPVGALDDKALQTKFRIAIDAVSDDTGWASLGPVGSHISKQASDFDSRTYGFTKLSELVRSLNYLETKQVEQQVRVRFKPRRSPKKKA